MVKKRSCSQRLHAREPSLYKVEPFSIAFSKTPHYKPFEEIHWRTMGKRG